MRCLSILDSRAGRGIEEFGSQQKQNPEEGIPEGGPIPLHRDTTVPIEMYLYLSISIYIYLYLWLAEGALDIQDEVLEYEQALVCLCNRNF